MLHFSDTLTLDRRHRTRDGYLAVRAKAARAGVYEYLGREVDPEGRTFSADRIVRVLRPREEVFHQDAVASFLMKPVTNDHPAQPVTADNWRSHAKGVVGKALRDGDFLAFDLVLMDASAIRDVDAGKRELSNGYSSTLEFKAGVDPDFGAYDAIQRNIRGNHVALVDRGRAGSACRINDSAECHAIPSEDCAEILRDGETYSACSCSDKTKGGSGDEPQTNLTQGDRQMATKTIIIDSVPFEVSDQAAAAIAKVQQQAADAAARAEKAEREVASLTADKANLEAERDQAKQALADAKPTPAQLLDAAKAYQATADKAKALGVTVTDSMDEAQIQRAAVDARLGDTAKDWSDAQVAACFAGLNADTKPNAGDQLRKVIADTKPIATDTRQLRDAARVGRYA